MPRRRFYRRRRPRRWRRPYQGNVCSYCGRKFTELPYQCKYCGERFCSKHHLPEAHKCEALPSRSWSTYADERGKREPVIVGGPPTTPVWKPRRKPRWGKVASVVGSILMLGIILSIIGVLLFVVGPHVVDEYLDVTTSELEEGVFNGLNEARVERGLWGLSWNDELARVARVHSQDMAENHFYSHQNQQGQMPSDRLGAPCAEVLSKLDRAHVYIFIIPIPKGEGTMAHETVTGWLNSPGHRAIILGEYSAIGVGVANDLMTYYFTAVLI